MHRGDQNAPSFLRSEMGVLLCPEMQGPFWILLINIQRVLIFADRVASSPINIPPGAVGISKRSLHIGTEGHHLLSHAHPEPWCSCNIPPGAVGISKRSLQIGTEGHHLLSHAHPNLGLAAVRYVLVTNTGTTVKHPRCHTPSDGY